MLPISDGNVNHAIAYLRAQGARDAAAALAAHPPEAIHQVADELITHHARRFNDLIDDAMIGGGKPSDGPPTDAMLAHEQAAEAVQVHTGALEHLDGVRRGFAAPRIRRAESLNREVYNMRKGRADDCDFARFYNPTAAGRDPRRRDMTPFDLGYHIIGRHADLMPSDSGTASPQSHGSNGSLAREHVSPELPQQWVAEQLSNLEMFPNAERAEYIHQFVDGSNHPGPFTQADRTAIEAALQSTETNPAENHSSRHSARFVDSVDTNEHTLSVPEDHPLNPGATNMRVSLPEGFVPLNRVSAAAAQTGNPIVGIREDATTITTRNLSGGEQSASRASYYRAHNQNNENDLREIQPYYRQDMQSFALHPNGLVTILHRDGTLSPLHESDFNATYTLSGGRTEHARLIEIGRRANALRIRRNDDAELRRLWREEADAPH